jgi:hypothetical protein
MDVMLISALRRRWHTGIGLATVHMLPWPYAVAILATTAAFLGYRLLAERARRSTLTTLVQRSPAGTTMFMDAGPGGPAMWVHVGDRDPHEPSAGGPGER